MSTSTNVTPCLITNEQNRRFLTIRSAAVQYSSSRQSFVSYLDKLVYIFLIVHRWCPCISKARGTYRISYLAKFLFCNFPFPVHIYAVMSKIRAKGCMMVSVVTGQLQFESEHFKARPPRFSSDFSRGEISSNQEIVYTIKGNW